jgi:hypothetical protein
MLEFTAFYLSELENAPDSQVLAETVSEGLNLPLRNQNKNPVG